MFSVGRKEGLGVWRLVDEILIYGRVQLLGYFSGGKVATSCGYGLERLRADHTSATGRRQNDAAQ